MPIRRVLQPQGVERSGVHSYMHTAATDAAAAQAAAAAVCLRCWCCLDLPYGCFQLWQDLEEVTHKAVVRQLCSSNGSNRRYKHSQSRKIKSSMPPTASGSQGPCPPALHCMHHEGRKKASNVTLVILIHRPKRATSHALPRQLAGSSSCTSQLMCVFRWGGGGGG